MLTLQNNTRIVEQCSELPEVPEGCDLFLDCETVSADESLTSGGIDPYLGDRVCGWAVTWNDNPVAYYIPIRHRGTESNLPVDRVNEWLKRTLRVAKRWINHNIKFDAHFAMVDGAEFDCDLVDTLTMAKLVNSDRMSHDLKDLLRDWLNIDQRSEQIVKQFLMGYKLPRNRRAKDYALVPIDLLGYYAGDDVLNNRRLYHWLVANLPESCNDIWTMEQKLTPVLWDMEHAGLRTDQLQLQKEKFLSLNRMIEWSTDVATATGMEYTDSAKFSRELFCDRWNLPILAFSKKTGNPSFDKEALQLYLGHPEIASDPERLETVRLLVKLRQESTYLGLFVDTFIEKADSNGYIHPSYNQVVRTGRMSCSRPNSQQQNERSKNLVHPDEDCAFFDADASQIEFRVIAHYIQDPDILERYRKDPRTDFHQWVADLCEMKRKPAKTINFARAYGAGDAKIIAQLSTNEDIVAAVSAEVSALIDAGKIQAAARAAEYGRRCMHRGKKFCQTYDERLPGIKRTAKRCSSKAKARGFIFNLYGRRRHLPAKACFVAFNTLCQGTAMDYIKRKMIQLAPRYRPDMRELGITMRANVHDAILFNGPVDVMKDLSVQAKLMGELDAQDPKLRVPVVWDGEYHEEAWR
jgi:DNA polymerase-1